jgi:hypothetical protein
VVGRGVLILGFGASTLVAVLLLVVAVTVIAAVAAGLAFARGWDPAPVAAWRHAWREAGYRAGGLWAEFVDWLRSRSP